MMLEFKRHFWHLMLELAPLLLLGLFIAAIIKLLLPKSWGKRWLGGQSTAAVTKAALIGTPLPLCSCSVMPVALSLYQQGVSKGATVSFLIATPENGIPSLAMSYVLLGPLMTIVRPLASVATAIFAGVMTDRFDSTPSLPSAAETSIGFELPVLSRSEPAETASTDSQSPSEIGVDPPVSQENADEQPRQANSVLHNILHHGGAIFREALGKQLDDLAVWVLIGVVVAAAMNCVLTPESFLGIGQSYWAYIVMAVVGVPIYVCASASTPMAASFLLAGISPGAVLVFLLSGPATNFATLGILHRQIGRNATLCYLVGVTIGPILCGFVLDQFLHTLGWEIGVGSLKHAHEHQTDQWWQVGSVVILGVAFVVRFFSSEADLLNWMRPWATQHHSHAKIGN